MFNSNYTDANENDLLIPGNAEVKVLGGNHTRAAIESLFSSGMMGGTVLVTLFENLTDEDALLIGVSHNQQDEEAKFMSFIDKTRNKLRTMAAVADLDQELLKKIVELSRAYKGATPIKQTAFTAFVTKSVEKQSKLLTSWEHDDETERDGGCSDADHAKQEEIESLKVI
ncbi:hypothetical protein DPMN_175116 [Dreissena polymorpha]|uniref:Uncharacterized protein n=1 Tax=Dreissena polymorpha TaxID=45954 RepID=A0A9D4IJ93_DREPO|nr:hypothetical protein DPMN_175116 [Dreissena polymorpha]